jgi:hypothetical protein
MIRTFSAMAIAGLVLVAVAGISQAAPIAPLPAGVMADHSNVMQVFFSFVTASDRTIKMLERNSIQSEAISS